MNFIGQGRQLFVFQKSYAKFQFGTEMFGHFVSYMLMLGHKNMQAYFCDTRYRMFHVEHFCFTTQKF